jgi:hypothetical protein
MVTRSDQYLDHRAAAEPWERGLEGTNDVTNIGAGQDHRTHNETRLLTIVISYPYHFS